MKTLNPVEIIIQDNKVSYNYNGVLYTKKEFEQEFFPDSFKQHTLQINRDKEKDYYYIWDLTTNTQVVDDDGNPIHFNSVDDAVTYINEE